jgi:hypothetical protein
MVPSDEILQIWGRLPPIGVAWLLRLKQRRVSVDALSVQLGPPSLSAERLALSGARRQAGGLHLASPGRQG